ncbi:hypothetical protein EVAR_80656_1 [Eumeta japonica]|uniref:Uncharacterized protein n=1 Tax=Eumeta variegata TaxID=151549 RepID=A0A4C1U3I5_EUMVA|nr:hypothetical protein EVAR_80656_1 [Eumeta japonica]
MRSISWRRHWRIPFITDLSNWPLRQLATPCENGHYGARMNKSCESNTFSELIFTPVLYAQYLVSQDRPGKHSVKDEDTITKRILAVQRRPWTWNAVLRIRIPVPRQFLPPLDLPLD